KLSRELKHDTIRVQLEIDIHRRFQVLALQTRRRMLVQSSTKLVNALGTNRDPRRMRVATKLLKQPRPRSQSIQQVIPLNTSSRAVGQTAVNRQHDTRS